MKEREPHELPALVGGEVKYLPPYVTVEVDGVELEVHPDYLEQFLKQREALDKEK